MKMKPLCSHEDVCLDVELICVCSSLALLILSSFRSARQQIITLVDGLLFNLNY